MSQHYIKSTGTHDGPTSVVKVDGGTPTNCIEAPTFSISANPTTLFADEHPTMEACLYNTEDGSSFPFQHANLQTVAPSYHPAEASSSPYFALEHNLPKTEALVHAIDDTASTVAASLIEFDDFINEDIFDQYAPTSPLPNETKPAENGTSITSIAEGPAIPIRKCSPSCSALCLVPYHYGGHSESHTLKLLYEDHAHLIPHWPPPSHTYLGFTPGPVQSFTDALLRSAPKGCLISDPVTLMQYRIAGKRPSQSMWWGEVISVGYERVLACDGYSDPLRWADFGCRVGMQVDAELMAKAKVRAQTLLRTGGALVPKALIKEEQTMAREDMKEEEREEGEESSDGMEWDNWFGMPRRFKGRKADAVPARSGVSL